MPAKAPTIRSLAKTLGLSRSTVAGVLRGNPHFSPATVQRVQRAAEAAGYRFNPLVGAVMSELRKSSLQRFRGVLAVVDLDGGRRASDPGSYHELLLESARARATELGYRVQVYLVGVRGLTLSRLDSILRAQGINGIFLLPSMFDPDLSRIDWSRYAAIYTDYVISRPALHTVCPDHFSSMIQILEHLQLRGYRKPGLFLRKHHNLRLRFHWSGAFLGYQKVHSSIGRVPLLLMDDWEPARFKAWFKQHQPDVVLGHVPIAIDWMRQMSARVPETHGFVCLNTVFQDRPCAGFDLQPALLGARAVELLIGQIQRGEIGIPEHPSITGIPARWVEGPTLRPVVAAG